ncbi:hypothetical protein HDU93_001866 [Gonapodya sp. JEL0774]|nr:hypothetical protein HDU93_001866 [Gonapodya sp. JEL0774]
MSNYPNDRRFPYSQMPPEMEYVQDTGTSRRTPPQSMAPYGAQSQYMQPQTPGESIQWGLAPSDEGQGAGDSRQLQWDAVGPPPQGDSRRWDSSSQQYVQWGQWDSKQWRTQEESRRIGGVRAFNTGAGRGPGGRAIFQPDKQDLPGASSKNRTKIIVGIAIGAILVIVAAVVGVVVVVRNNQVAAQANDAGVGAVVAQQQTDMSMSSTTMMMKTTSKTTTKATTMTSSAAVVMASTNAVMNVASSWSVVVQSRSASTAALSATTAVAVASTAPAPAAVPTSSALMRPLATTTRAQTTQRQQVATSSVLVPMAPTPAVVAAATTTKRAVQAGNHF